MILALLQESDFFNAVPLNGSATYDDIGKHTKLPVPLVRRILRYAMAIRLFAEEKPNSDHIVHTAITAHAARNPEFNAWISHTNVVQRAAQTLPDVLRRLYKDGTETVSESELESAFALLDIDGVGQPSTHFEYLKRDEPGKPKGWRELQFAQAMSAGRHMPGMHMDAVLKGGFDWAGLGSGKVVDVGGSGGHDAVVLAKNFPNLSITVQDLPEQQEAFEQHVPAHLRSRLSFQPHDFFKPEPLDADVYMLKHVLHDWPDAKAVEILRAVSSALKQPHQRLILFEHAIMPTYDSNGEQSTCTNVMRTMSAMDMFMWKMGNGKERTLDDWKKLLQQTDPSLELVNNHTVPGATASFLEIRKVQ